MLNPDQGSRKLKINPSLAERRKHSASAAVSLAKRIGNFPQSPQPCLPLNSSPRFFAIIRRQISPAAAERDSQWRTRDDHFENANMEKTRAACPALPSAG
jgi:hypothetical protein